MMMVCVTWKVFYKDKFFFLFTVHENKISFKSCTFEKNKTSKHFWKEDQNFECVQKRKKVVHRESRVIFRKISEGGHYVKNPYHY